MICCGACVCVVLVTRCRYDALVGDSRVDAVYIPLPNNLHFEWARQCLLAGKHVLVEKPMCLTEAHVRELAVLAAERKVRWAVWSMCVVGVCGCRPRIIGSSIGLSNSASYACVGHRCCFPIGSQKV